VVRPKFARSERVLAESAEILALRHGIVTGLLLAPAVLFRLAEAGDIALSAGSRTVADSACVRSPARPLETLRQLRPGSCISGKSLS
jgi:hypothetical protein